MKKIEDETHIIKENLIESEIVTFDIGGMFGHIGVAMLVYYGNTLILNIRAEARNKNVQPLILKIAISFANAFFLVFSIVGYVAYRD